MSALWERRKLRETRKSRNEYGIRDGICPAGPAPVYGVWDGRGFDFWGFEFAGFWFAGFGVAGFGFAGFLFAGFWFASFWFAGFWVR
ncbi:hypothetical protein B5E84_01575 [Lachnoclostridium sp. An14]|nr:hypothetical protein B5E84_01575 [Lachnoclostridium sp. An14]